VPGLKHVRSQYLYEIFKYKDEYKKALLTLRLPDYISVAI